MSNRFDTIDGINFVISDENDNQDARVWEVAKIDSRGHTSRTGPLVTFDRHRVYSLFADFPDHMTEEQISIIKEEMPYWADFFADRLK